MTITSAHTARLFGVTATVAGWVRASFARFRGPTSLKDVSRTEFDQMARDLDLSHPELYGLLTGQILSTDLVEKRLAKLEIPAEQIEARLAPEQAQESVRTQAFLPIGPSCC